MKIQNYLTILSLLLLSETMFSQFDKKAFENELNTYWTSTYNLSDQIKIKLKGDSLNGQLTFRNNKGALVFQGDKVNGKYDGEIIKYFNTGEVAMLVTYNAGILDGEYLVYTKVYDNEGDEYRQEAINSGFIKPKPGEKTVFNYKMMLIKKMFYLDDELHGDFFIKHSNGKLQSERKYDHGKLIGNKTVDYNYQGQVIEETEFMNGKKHGTSKSFNNDHLLKLETWKNGKLHGSLIEYDYDGEKRLQKTYVNNEYDGIQYSQIDYDRLLIEYFIQGDIVVWFLLDHNNIILQCAKKSENINLQFKNGNVVLSLKKLPNGIFTRNNMDYLGENKCLFTTYYYNGQIKSSRNLPFGVAKAYHENGQIKEECYIDSVLHGDLSIHQAAYIGEHKVYDATGKILRNGKWVNGEFEGDVDDSEYLVSVLFKDVEEYNMEHREEVIEEEYYGVEESLEGQEVIEEEDYEEKELSLKEKKPKWFVPEHIMKQIDDEIAKSKN